MKLIYALLCTLIFFSSYPQKNAFSKTQTDLPFAFYKKELTQEVKQTIDKYWDELEPGHELQFHLLTKEEDKKLSNDHKFKLTSYRADSVATYIHRKRIGARYTSFNIDYFDHVTNGECGTNASYKAFTKRKGIISVVVEKDIYYQKHYPHSEGSTISNTCETYDLEPFYGGVIEGNQGTLVKFPPNCFRGYNFKSGDKVKVLLCEYYTTSDITLAGLTTLNNDRIIETGGMVFIEVKYQEEALSLKSDKNIQLFFPNRFEKEKNGMRSFDGKKNNGLINWELNEKANTRYIGQGNNLFEDENIEDSTVWNGVMEGEEGYTSEFDGYLVAP